MNITTKNRRLACSDRTHCVACGACAKVCPRQAITIHRGLYALIDSDRCVGCGLCARECPASVITIGEVGA